MVFVLPVSVLFRGPLTFLILVGGIGGRGGIKMASASTLSANEPAKDLILVHTVQLKPMEITHFLGRMVSSDISDVVFASVHSEKIRLKKLIMIIKRASEAFSLVMKTNNCLRLCVLTWNTCLHMFQAHAPPFLGPGLGVAQ